jgi:hypothetical protein
MSGGDWSVKQGIIDIKINKDSFLLKKYIYDIWGTETRFASKEHYTVNYSLSFKDVESMEIQEYKYGAHLKLNAVSAKKVIKLKKKYLS